MGLSAPLHQSPTLEGLPKQFVSALRTLFDILDEKAIGLVKFTDIENRWQDDGTKGLPKGVIESLRKVTPPNGLLSFERFCAGLKICLLRNQMERRKRGGGSDEGCGRPPSAPLLEVEPKQAWSVRQSSMSQQRTISMPQLPSDPSIGIPLKPPLYGPPKPPRSALGGVSLERSVDKAEIRSALASWQMGMMLEETTGKGRQERARSMGDGKDAGRLSQGQATHSVSGELHKKAASGRRREPRRHTLQNGIDYNMLKRLKQMEEEKEVLSSGLEAVERARDWYLKQMAALQEKMTNLGRTGLTEQWSEALGERVELQRARVLEVNRHLAALTDPAASLPLHMNLALTPQTNPLVARLRQQNHLLTQEVNKKSDRITALEREKASLIRELFHSRGSGRPREQPDEPQPFI